MTTIKDLFAADVTRDIPPVIYFHEQSPAKLRDEVGEYVVTGGWEADHPNRRRVPNGIHEQFVRLLARVATELDKRGGPELPNAWISGFYGSGKSSFAKLLGLALDGVVLPDGTALADALLARDRSQRREELVTAWRALTAKIQPIAAVFDIGGVARDNEHIHAAVVRQVQRRLGYCAREPLVADFELKLERDGEYARFLTTARDVLGRSWEEARERAMVEDDFSHVLHALYPDRYVDPTSWIDSRAGTATRAPSAEEAVHAIADMLRFRAPGRTLFIVVDEVSQYLRQDHERMLKLQSFASALGATLKGRAWLFVTGQEKLEEESEATVLGKLKDRFPAPLRVHLDPTNIRDVVHRRLLQKTPGAEERLRALLERHRADLKLFAYGCDAVTVEDLVEVYPLLPSHIDLLMAITSALRSRSTRAQGDDHAIRGLLQMLGELFRTQRLAEREVGALVTLDAVYEVQASALDSDVQNSMARILAWCARSPDEGGAGSPTAPPPPGGGTPDLALCARAARAVALLELVQESVPTTAELVARVLYDRLDRGDTFEAVTRALEALRGANLLGYSERQGYKIQSSAGQEWERERRNIASTPQERGALVQEALKKLFDVERPRLQGVSFPWTAYYTDGHGASDVRLQDGRQDAVVTVDLRSGQDAAAASWVTRSTDPALDGRIVWIAGAMLEVDAAASELYRSKFMADKYLPRRDSLPREKQRLLDDERARASRELPAALEGAVAAAWHRGRAWFRGAELPVADAGPTFGAALTGLGQAVLGRLYPHFDATVVTETELMQLLERDLTGVSTKFLSGGLGILSLDAGKLVPHGEGAIPTRVRQYVEERGGTAGAALFSHFGRPPYGYAPTVVRACLAGLLRAHRVRVRPADGPEITSVSDPGTKDLFRRERDLRAADVFPAGQGPLGPRDRVAIARLFREALGVEIEPENEVIADAVYQHFPGRQERLRQLEARLNRLPGAPPTPAPLQKLHKALEDARRSRQVEPTVLAVKQHLEDLRDGLQLLTVLDDQATDAAIGRVREAADVLAYQHAQLADLGAVDADVDAAAVRVGDQLKLERPWRGVEGLAADLDLVRQAYVHARAALLAAQATEAEAARARIKRTPGYERLDADQSHHVLRPLAEVIQATTAEAVAPTLRVLRDAFAGALHRAEEEAKDRLDELLARKDEKTVVRVPLGLSGRVLSEPRDLDALIEELRTRIGPHLAAKARVRLG